MKRTLGPWIFWGIALLAIPLWIISGPESTFRNTTNGALIYGSQAAALLGTALFGLTFLLSTRSRVLENLFGGLDKMYQTHHRMGLTATLLLLAHPLLLASRWIPHNWSRVFEFMLPFHNRTAVNLGIVALWGLLLLIALTVFINMKYDKWKMSHKFMGLAFLLGVFHFFLIDGNIANNLPLLIYFAGISAIGIGSVLYYTVFFEQFSPQFECTTGPVSQLNDHVLEISLRPDTQKPEYIAGQFFFFRFHDSKLTTESHPFTICSPPDEPEMKIMVKALGDYTNNLYHNLQPGTKARLEGPYGRFNFKDGGDRQIWIGGGVGIAPFICWSRTLARHAGNMQAVDLYYCVNTRSEAVYEHELTELANQLNWFHFHLITADHDGYMDISCLNNLNEQDIFMCGPKPMLRKMTTQLRSAGISQSNIFYEDFDFS